MSNKDCKYTFSIRVTDYYVKDPDTQRHEPIPDVTLRIYSGEKYDKDGDKELNQELKTGADGIATFTVSHKNKSVSFYSELDTPTHRKCSYPNNEVTTTPYCHVHSDNMTTSNENCDDKSNFNPNNIQELRFKPLDIIIGRVKAYNRNLLIGNNEEDYHSNWRNEIYTVDKEQEIMLQAFLVDHEEYRKTKNEIKAKDKDGMLFLQDDNLHKAVKEDILWCYKLVGPTIFTPGSKRNSKLFLDVSTNAGELEKYTIIRDKDAVPLTGLSISLKLSDIFTDKMLDMLIESNQNITFFPVYKGFHDRDEKKPVHPHYRTNFKGGTRTENVPSIELKIVKNRFSMFYNGENLSLLENEREICSYQTVVHYNYDLNKTIPDGKTYIVGGSTEPLASGDPEGRYFPLNGHIPLREKGSAVAYIHNYIVGPIEKKTHDRYKEIGIGYIELLSKAYLFLVSFKNFVKMGLNKDIELKVKYKENYVIKITRFKQTMKSTLSRFAIYSKDKDGRYILHDIAKNTIKTFTTHDNLTYGGYILERPGPDCITSALELRIPEGYYNTVWHKRDKPSNDTIKLHSEHVSPNRQILIHKGNNPIDIMGCLLPGELDENKDDYVGSSGGKVKNIKDVVVSLHKGKYPTIGANVLITVIIKNEFEMEE